MHASRGQVLGTRKKCSQRNWERRKKCRDRKILEHFKKSCKGGKSVADAVKIAIIRALDAGILEQATGSGVSQGGCHKMTYFIISDAIESMHVN